MLDGFSLKQPAGTEAGKGSHADCFRSSSPPDWKAQEGSFTPTGSLSEGRSRPPPSRQGRGQPGPWRRHGQPVGTAAPLLRELPIVVAIPELRRRLRLRFAPLTSVSARRPPLQADTGPWLACLELRLTELGPGGGRGRCGWPDHAGPGCSPRKGRRCRANCRRDSLAPGLLRHSSASPHSTPEHSHACRTTQTHLASSLPPCVFDRGRFGASVVPTRARFATDGNNPARIAECGTNVGPIRSSRAIES
jgi:hypothetical protein